MDPLTEPSRSGGLAFTVLVPVWAGDHPSYFGEAMESLTRGRPRPTEVLIARDGELPPALSGCVHDCMAAGARATTNPGARGLHHNLNHALKQVRTPWVARLDADDVNLPERFDLQIQFLRLNPDVSVIGGAIVEFDESGREWTKPMPLTHDAIVRRANWRNPINHMTAFYQLKPVLEAGGYPNVSRKEDYALWLAMISQDRIFANLPQPLVRARLGEDFHARRSGLHNLKSEFEIFRLKRRTGRIGLAPALAAMSLRAGALALEGPATMVYRRALRR